ncbi:SLC13 family permease [Persicimonas caeni]|uniref:SLC13 family permease n=1 Tax=Persicimonas caeni TaxID=2292766 RepID=A0A4Y6PZX6_PERCE|nr:SLC13 family permease [Persicimonas caeni]QDG53871.1 SLC13 family permease [Persicimonas caeni]QED35092.1 SLC13 family permease [Persicimonas caeni]
MDMQLILVLVILATTVFLIVTERWRIDLVALMAMLSLVWVGAISPEEARSGFSSNAVLAIIGVMVMGRGLFKSGVTDKLAHFILRVAGASRRRIISTTSLTVGLMSGVMQNIGAAALFLPVMMGISKRQKIPVSSLLMPMGFAALVGGTLTMVGTSSLIVLNDLLAHRGLETFHLFSVTPIGVVLLVTAVAYFALFGPLVFPSKLEKMEDVSPSKKRINVWGLSDAIYTFRVLPDSPLAGKTVEESQMGKEFDINLLRAYSARSTDRIVDKNLRFEAGQALVIQGREEDVLRFAEGRGLQMVEQDEKTPAGSKRGYLEVVIPARSNIVGKTLREAALRETYNVQVVLFFSDSEIIEEGIADRVIKAGDTLVLHGRKENLQFFNESEDFISVTPFEYEPTSPEQALKALASFVGALAVVFVSDLPISIGFLSGAVAMILAGVLSIEEAYRAIEWQVVFLIAGLIPIGLAMENSGVAALIADSLVGALEGAHPLVILASVGVLTTGLSLLMSNVAATVLLVPLVLGIAGLGGLSPQALVLQVGVCAANSFVLPTHHVNALLMTPGGYRVADYLKAGSILSVVFVTVSTLLIYVLFA